MSNQEHLNALLDSAPDPVLTVARDGCIVRCNRMAVQFFGYCPRRFNIDHLCRLNFDQGLALSF